MFSLRSSLIALSILVALVLQVTPMPAWADPYRPDWVFLVIAYWAMALPHRVSIGVACMNGLVLDILLGTTLGVHSIALSLVIWVLAMNYQRLRNYSVWQQVMIIGLISTLYHLIVFWLLRLLTDIDFIFAYLWPVLTSMVIWPYVFFQLRKLRRQFNIS